MEVFTLIARKKNVALVFVSYLLVALAAISLLTICIGFAPGILFAVVFGLIAYLMIMAQNTEFEYSYFDGELRFAKIKNKSRRKRLGIYSMESVAAIAPAGDRSVYNYENGNKLKEIDYTSGQKDVPYYDIVIKSAELLVCIFLFPNVVPVSFFHLLSLQGEDARKDVLCLLIVVGLQDWWFESPQL